MNRPAPSPALSEPSLPEPSLAGPTLNEPALTEPALEAVPPSVPDAPTQASVRDYLAVSLYWFALSFMWGALLTIALPQHVQHLFGERQKDIALGILSASGAFIAAISQIAFGSLSDESRHPWGRRRPYIFWGTLLAVPFLLLLPLPGRGQLAPGWDQLALLIVLLCGLQLFANVAGGPYQAMMHDLIPADRHGAAAAWIGAAGLVGRVGGMLCAVALLLRGPNGFAMLTAVFAVVLLATMGAVMFCARERPLPPLVTPAPPTSPLTAAINALRVPLRPYPDFIWLIVSRGGIMMGIYTVSFALLYYVQKVLGYSEKESLTVIFKLLLVATLGGVVGTIPSGNLADRLGKKPVLYVANIICMVSGLIFAVASNVNVAFVAAFVFGSGMGAFAAVDWALATGLLPPREPARYMGAWGLSDTVPQVLSPLIAGPLAFFLNAHIANGGGYRALMGLSLLWFLVGTIALRPIREPGAKAAD